MQAFVYLSRVQVGDGYRAIFTDWDQMATVVQQSILLARGIPIELRGV